MYKGEFTMKNVKCTMKNQIKEDNKMNISCIPFKHSVRNVSFGRTMMPKHDPTTCSPQASGEGKGVY